MLTIFHLLILAGAAAGLWAGISLGADLFGWAGAVAGGAAGLLVGAIVGRLPLALALRRTRRRLRATPAEELRRDLRRGVWPAYHLFFAELARRGEPLDGELDVLLDLLGSDDHVRRLHGAAILRAHFPALAARIPEYDPDAGAEACRSHLRRLAG